MKKYCTNSFELAVLLLKKQTHPREWGQLEGFSYTDIYKKYFWKMGDKYIRGKNIFAHYCEEYQECEFQCLSAFIDYIDKSGLQFPLWYSSELNYSDGYSSSFTVTYETDNQLSLF